MLDGFEHLCPLVTGKSKKPCCFKNVDMLPTIYDANEKVWMTP